jgi:UDP-GlcNAc3NAcA epimerase
VTEQKMRELSVLCVVGARPQFIKHAAVSTILRKRHREILIHTGQHHDPGMSQLFFEQLGIPEPDRNLGIQGGPHGQMTGRMLEALEGVVTAERPDFVLVYGDTNSTLAGALVGAKLRIPVAHVEAGLRSFNRAMPEEINRVVTDHVASLLLCPTKTAVDLLAREGVSNGVHLVGDVMYDSMLQHLDRARALTPARHPSGDFALATVHRAENTDDRARLTAILDGLSNVGLPVLLPIHPRTRKILETESDLAKHIGPSVSLCEPLGYLELVAAMAAAKVILTDSGGMQKEAFFLRVPCVTLRDETEWVETIELGANRLAGANTVAIIQGARAAIARGFVDTGERPYGDGHAAERIVACLEGHQYT